jgi:hypothetical protein
VPPIMEPRDLLELSREELLALVVKLQRQVTELRASNEALRAEIDQRTRGGTRQAAPLSKGTRVAEPKPPGLNPGSGTFRYREAPPPKAVTEPPGDVRVTRDACPACGGPLQEERVDVASWTEIPARPQPQVTPYRVWVCRCTVCGHQVRGQYLDLAAGASRGDGPPCGGAGDGCGADVALWHGPPGTQSPRGVARLDWGAADPEAPHPGGPAACCRSGGHRGCPGAGRTPGGPGWCTPMTPAGGWGASPPT